MKYLLILTLFVSNVCFSQELSPQELLERSSNYHDPDGKWSMMDLSATVESALEPVMADQFGQSELTTAIAIDNSKGVYDVSLKVRGDAIRVQFNMDECVNSINGSTELTEDQINKHKGMVDLGSCETAKTAVNYHVFLMGLPMKLVLDKAPVGSDVRTTEFFGAACYAIEVAYEKDTWQFYFDKSSYAMIGCEFKFQNGFGEKIQMEFDSFNGVKLPTKRIWYSLDEDLLVTDQIKIN